VSPFVVGHWASSGVVSRCHVNFSSPPTNLLEVSNTIGEELPVSFYHELVRWFSKDGNTAVEVGCGSEVGSYSLFVYDNIHLEHVNFFEDVVNGVTKRYFSEK